MGRSPRSPPSSKQDTVGGASWRKPGRTCPDRSWCGTTSPGTPTCGDTDRQTSRDELLEQHLRAGGEGKKKTLLGRETEGCAAARKQCGQWREPNRFAPDSARFAYATPVLT